MEGPRRGATTLLVLLALAACPGARTCRAADDGDTLPNYAFAAYLGNGFYSASGLKVQVYNLPLGFTLRRLEGHDFGIRLRLPVSMGFFDFKAVDILETGLPDGVETLSFVPGVELQFPVGKNWVLTPFLDAGAGRNSTGGQVTYIFGAGVRSLFVFHGGGFTFRLGNTLLYAGNRAEGADLGSDFGSIVTGIDARHPLGFNVGAHRADVSLYAANYLYSSLEFRRFRADPVDVVVQYEAGFTFGTATLPGHWIYRLVPRLGLGYRFGDGLSVVRLVLGMPF
jgi:hypothetical protein